MSRLRIEDRGVAIEDRGVANNYKRPKFCPVRRSITNSPSNRRLFLGRSLCREQERAEAAPKETFTRSRYSPQSPYSSNQLHPFPPYISGLVQ